MTKLTTTEIAYLAFLATRAQDYVRREEPVPGIALFPDPDDLLQILIYEGLQSSRIKAEELWGVWVKVLRTKGYVYGLTLNYTEGKSPDLRPWASAPKDSKHDISIIAQLLFKYKKAHIPVKPTSYTSLANVDANGMQLQQA